MPPKKKPDSEIEIDGVIIRSRDTTVYEPDPANLNQHTERGMSALETSLDKSGIGRGIVVDRDDRIIAGNATHERTVDQGFTRVIEVETDGTVLVVTKRKDMDLLDDGGRARLLAIQDNRVAQLNLNVNEIDLIQMAKEMDIDISSLYTDVELSRIITENEPDSPIPPPEGSEGLERGASAKAAMEKWGCKSGDLWIIRGKSGKEHRIVCGNSRKKADVDRLMDGKIASMGFTSPPYNASVNRSIPHNQYADGDESKYISGDEDERTDEEYLALLNEFTDVALNVCDYLFVNIQMLSGNKITLIEYLYEYRNLLCDISIWDKGNAQPAMAHRVMNSQFEFVHILSRRRKAVRAIGSRDFWGDVPNVYNGTGNSSNPLADAHAATFPVHFPFWFISKFTNPEEIVFDPFGGTGTTLVACDQLNRTGYMMELEPNYVAIALEQLSLYEMEIWKDGR